MAALELEARLDNLLDTAQTETADIDLFAPIQEREECPICLLPFPVDNDIVFMPCCGKNVCGGCMFKNMITEMKNKKKGCEQAVYEYKCVLCRQPPSGKNTIKCYRKLMKNNNPLAFMHMANRYRSGEGVFQSDTKSLEMLTKAAELGLAGAYANIGLYYEEGIAVEQDDSKAVAFYEVAAKKGSISAHQQLAMYYRNNGNSEESIRYLRVAASAGDQTSMDKLMVYYKLKSLSKEELTQALRACQESNDQMKSEDRDAAREMSQSQRGIGR